MGDPLPVLYILSKRLITLSKGASVNEDRALLVHSLVHAFELHIHMYIQEARPATIEELRQYHHDLNYLSALHHHPRLPPPYLHKFGLLDDCHPFPGLYEYAALIAGGSLQAASALAARQCRAAINLDGGRHHARRASAAGFCYLNDVILSILHLLGTFQRVAYFDLDIHHGDAVEEAFAATPRVVTASLHKQSTGFFPGSGALGSGGEGPGQGFTLNLPLGDNLRDDIFIDTFKTLADGVMEVYTPDCIVLQCGVDGLAGDPIAQSSWSLTPKAYAAATRQLVKYNVPLLVLGGGGYNSPAAAATWVGVVGEVLGREVGPDIPADHEYLDRYGPAYTLQDIVRPTLAPDTNNATSAQEACRLLLARLKAAVQRQWADRVVEEGQGGSGKRQRGAE